MSLTKIKFHGELGEKLERNEWELEVESVAEAMHAVDIMSNRKLSSAVMENEKQNVKYKLLVDGKNFLSRNIEGIEDVADSELVMKKKMESIDIVPVLEGAGDDAKDIAMVVGGALALGAGFMYGNPFLTQLGLFAILSGMANLLAEPPDFEDFREIQQVNKRESYLFGGPINTYNPGGPVPVGYGRIMAGSLTVAYSQTNEDKKIFFYDEANDEEIWYP